MMIRRSKKDLEIYFANKTKSNPKEFYTYVRIIVTIIITIIIIIVIIINVKSLN